MQFSIRRLQVEARGVKSTSHPQLALHSRKCHPQLSPSRFILHFGERARNTVFGCTSFFCVTSCEEEENDSDCKVDTSVVIISDCLDISPYHVNAGSATHPFLQTRAFASGCHTLVKALGMECRNTASLYVFARKIPVWFEQLDTQRKESAHTTAWCAPSRLTGS